VAALLVALLAVGATLLRTTPGTQGLGRFYAGTWRGSVNTAARSIYGNVSGKEYLFELVMESDGNARLTTLDGHEDLLSGEGTWEAVDETGVTLHLVSKDIELTVVDDATLAAPAQAFGVGGFDTLHFEYS
jgi:hypothetical protein